VKDIRKRLEELEGYVAIKKEKSIRDYTLEQIEFLREVADRVVKRMRRDHINREDQETLEKVTAEVIAEVENSMSWKGNENTEKGKEL